MALWFNEVKPWKNSHYTKCTIYLLNELGKGILSIQRIHRPRSLLNFPRVSTPVLASLKLGVVSELSLKPQYFSNSSKWKVGDGGQRIKYTCNKANKIKCSSCTAIHFKMLRKCHD